MFGAGNKKASTKEMVHGAEDQHQQEPRAKAQKIKATPKSGHTFLQSKTILGIICLVTAVLIGFVAVPFAQQRAARLTPVVVLTQDVDMRMILTSDMLTVENRAANGIPAGAVTTVEAAVGKYVARDGLTGDILTSARLTDQYPTDDPELLELPEGKVAMAVALDSLEQSVASKLRAGDVIQLYAVLNTTTAQQTDAPEALIVPELQAVEILSVTNNAGDNVYDQETEATETTTNGDQLATVVLAVSPKQAAVLAGLAAEAKLHAALVLRGDEHQRAALLAEQDKYLETLAPATAATAPMTAAGGKEGGEHE